MRPCPRRFFTLAGIQLFILAMSPVVAGAQCPNPVGASCPPGFYMAEITAEFGQPLRVTASGVTGSSSVILENSAVEIEGSTVRILTWFYLGPWAMPDTWAATFELPPLLPGEYSVELLIWDGASQMMVLNSTSSLQVQTPVPALSLSGVVVLVGLLAFTGLAIIRRNASQCVPS